MLKKQRELKIEVDFMIEQRQFEPSVTGTVSNDAVVVQLDYVAAESYISTYNQLGGAFDKKVAD